MSHSTRSRVNAVVSRESERARSAEVPERVIVIAAQATLQVFSAPTDRGNGLDRRVATYFRRVVTRGITRGSETARARARMVASAVVSELRSGGRADTDVFAHLARGWHDSIPADILEEFRLRLCA